MDADRKTLRKGRVSEAKDVIESGALSRLTPAMETPPGITITNAQLESVAQGLAALDGLQLKDGFSPFKYDDETTWWLAETGEAVTRAVAVLTAARKSLAKQHGVTEHMKVAPENAAGVSAFLDGIDVLLSKEVKLP